VEYRINGVHVKFNIFFILSLFTLYSCGGGQSSIKLEVTRSFSTGNSTFDGGLLIIAKNSVSGEEYYAPLATQSTVSLNLNYGTWDITAIGWDNNEQLFEGDILCGSTTKVFSKEVDSAPISVSSANCSSPKLLKILTCGALFDPADPTKLISGSNLSDGFCSQSSYHPVFNEMRPGSIKISLPKKLPGESLGEALVSACIVPSNDPGLPFNTSKKFPDNAPFIVNVYQDSACTEIKAKYHFKKGTISYDPSTHDFDAVIKNVTSTGNISDSITNVYGRIIALASPESKRGRTPFITEIPQFKCSSGKCATLPQLPSGIKYIVSKGYNSFIINEATSCSNITFGSTYIRSGSGQCEEISSTQKRISVEIESPQTNNTSIEIDLFKVGNGSFVKGLLKERDLHVYREIANTLGVGTSVNDIKESIQEKDQKDLSYISNGMLIEIADLLSPSKIGGMLWGNVCSTSALSTPVTKEISIKEDGQDKKFKIVLMNPPSSYVPAYISYSSNPWNETATLNYNRRIIFSHFVGPVGYKTEMVLDLVCDGTDDPTSTSIKKIGKLEKQSSEFHSSNEINIHKSIMYWNTTTDGKNRMETYHLEERGSVVSGAFSATNVRTHFNRSEDTGSDTASKIKLTSLGYEYWKDSNTNTGKETLHSHDINISGTDITLFDGDYIQRQSSTQGIIFNDQYKLKEKNKIRFNQKSNMDHVKMANGSMLSVIKGSSGLIVKHFNGSNYIEKNISTNADLFDFDLSPDGTKAAIVTSAAASNTIYGYFYNSSNNSWNMTNPSTTTPSTNPPSKITVRVLNSGENHFGAIVDGVLYSGISDTTSMTSLSQIAGGNQLYATSTINSYEVIKSNSNFWIFIHENLNLGYTLIQFINYCKINSANGSCNPVTINQAETDLSAGISPESISNSFSAYASPDGKNITLSYYKTSNNTHTEHFNKWTISDDGTIATTNGYQNVDFMSGQSGNVYKMTMNSITDIGQNEVNILIPFKQAAEPNFKMNYMSLNPTHLKNYIFTSPNTFENIGQ
jgi:hypothetical protein